MSNKDILTIMTGSHPVHVKYANAINSEIFKLDNNMHKKQQAHFKAMNLLLNSMSIPSEYNTLLTENCYYYPAIKRKFRLLKSNIINLNSGPLFYNILNGVIGNQESKILKSLAKEVDGFLVQGEYGKQILKKMDFGKPFRTTYPFISSSVFNSLENIKPKLNNKTITIVATNDINYKGVDLLLYSFLIAQKSDPNLKLKIAGNIDQKQITPLINQNKIKNVECLGFVDSLSSLFSESSLYVHPARGETFGISILEAMLAGVPAIVSKETGAREVVEKVEKKFVVPIDSEILAEKILKYFELSNSRKKLLSQKSKKHASKFQEKPMLNHFKKQFYSLLDEIS